MWKIQKSNVILCLVILCLSGIKFETAQAQANKCILPLKPDWSFFSPLIFTKTGTLISTENFSEEIEDITLEADYEVLLSCTPNYFREFSSEKVLNATCKNGKTLVVNGLEKNFVSELSCEVRSIEEIITPVTGCPPKARSIEYGYTNPVNEKSYILGEACYDVKRGQTLFTHIKLKSKNNNVEELALKIKNKNYLRQEHPTSFYKIELMKALNLNEMNERFKGVFGAKNIPNVSTKKYVNEDMLTHKQYQPILKLAWNYAIVTDEDLMENMELLQQDVLALNADNLEIYTGSHGVLSLKNKNGDYIDLYLKEGKFPVPKYLWTVVKSGNKATAFVIFNKTQLSDKEKQKDSFCTSKCEEISWISALLEKKQYKQIENGLVLCCEFNDFQKTVKEMPNLTDVNDMLK